MTYYATCLNCAVDTVTCERRATISNALKGQSITSVKFKCHDRLPMFHRGQRVEFYWRYYNEDGSGDEYIATFVGTIMREKPGNKRFSVRVDPDNEIYDLTPAELLKNPEFISVRPDDIRALDEPDRPMCSLCAAYRDAPDCDRLCLNKYNHNNPVEDCWK